MGLLLGPVQLHAELSSICKADHGRTRRNPRTMDKRMQRSLVLQSFMWDPGCLVAVQELVSLLVGVNWWIVSCLNADVHSFIGFLHCWLAGGDALVHQLPGLQSGLPAGTRRVAAD